MAYCLLSSLSLAFLRCCSSVKLRLVSTTLYPSSIRYGQPTHWGSNCQGWSTEIHSRPRHGRPFGRSAVWASSSCGGACRPTSQNGSCDPSQVSYCCCLGLTWMTFWRHDRYPYASSYAAKDVERVRSGTSETTRGADFMLDN